MHYRSNREFIIGIANLHIEHFFQVQVESLFFLGFGVDLSQRGLGAERGGWGKGRDGGKADDEEADGNREFHFIVLSDFTRCDDTDCVVPDVVV